MPAKKSKGELYLDKMAYHYESAARRHIASGKEWTFTDAKKFMNKYVKAHPKF